MAIENSELNDSPALRSSNASLTGGTGDGNRLSIADLERGYVPEATPPRTPFYDRIDLPYLLGDL
jgi:hypothetical protein